MTDFSASTFEATITDINSGLGQIPKHLDEGYSAVQNTLSSPLVFGWLADALVWAWNKVCELTQDFLNTMSEILEGASAPVLFFFRAYDWITDVKEPMVDLKAAASPDALIGSYYWSGQGATAYRAAVADQPAAAGATAEIGQTMAIQLGLCAAAGLGFYVAIGVIVVKFVAAIIVAVAAFASAVFSEAGLALIVEEAAVTPALITAAVIALTTVLGVSGNAMIQMESAYAGFPGAHWPDTKA